MKNPITAFVCLTFIVIGCDTSNEFVIKNNTLPEEINLNPITNEIIDSTFVFENGIKTLEAIQYYGLKDGIVISSNRKYYANDTLKMTMDDTFDINGNRIERNTYSVANNSYDITKRKLDAYGNIIELESTRNEKVTVIEYQNSYKENKLAMVKVISADNGNIIDHTTYKYDHNGNLIEEWIGNSLLNAKNLYEYNSSNQLILYQHVRHGIAEDSVSYHYKNGLLYKKESYNPEFNNSTIYHFQYNENGQLILETQDAYDFKTEYGNYDSFGNWQLKKAYFAGEISRLITRSFINEK